jgi:hypothetical protein
MTCDVVAIFISEVSKPLPLVVVHTLALWCQARSPSTADGLPRRSVRVQGRRRVSNPETQA